MRQFIVVTLLTLWGGGAVAATVAPFSLPKVGADGTTATFATADHPNGVFLVEAFQLRCAPCNENAPKVQALARFFSYEPRFVALDIGIDRQVQDYRQWIAIHKPVGPVLMDSKRELFASGALSGRVTPTTWVLDCRLDVTWRHEGVWNDETRRSAKAAIDAALATDCGSP